MSSCPLCQSNNLEHFFERQDKHLGTRTYFRCHTCALTFLDPAQRFSKEEEKVRYDLHENDPSDKDYRTFLSQLTDPLLAKLKPGALGLDFGCGPGPTISVMLKEKGFEIRNYDPLYFPDDGLLEGEYDFCIATEVVEHFYDPCKNFALLHRLIKPKGWLGIMTKVLDQDETFADWWYHREPSHVCFYKHETFQWIAKHFRFDMESPCPNVYLFQK